MLAQNFKTPAELQISDVEFDALFKTLGMMEREELVHIYHPGTNSYTFGKFTGHFNMADWNDVKECGTVCCIGGTADLIGGVDLNLTAHKNRALHNLFYSSSILVRYSQITVAQAATALRNYLTHGEPCWAEALAT